MALLNDIMSIGHGGLPFFFEITKYVNKIIRPHILVVG
jgi:hypothetical protein